MVLRWQKMVKIVLGIGHLYYIYWVEKYITARFVYPSVSSGQTMKGCRGMIGQVKL